MDVLVKRTDLAGNWLRTHSGFHCTAITVTNHKHHLDTKYCRSVFETGDGCRSCKIARNAHHEQMTDGLIKDQLDGHPGIGTGEDGSKGLLLFNRIVTEYLQVLFQRHQPLG